jgi:hypothetical protein
MLTQEGKAPEAKRSRNDQALVLIVGRRRDVYRDLERLLPLALAATTGRRFGVASAAAWPVLRQVKPLADVAPGRGRILASARPRGDAAAGRRRRLAGDFANTSPGFS